MSHRLVVKISLKMGDVFQTTKGFVDDDGLLQTGLEFCTTF